MAEFRMRVKGWWCDGEYHVIDASVEEASGETEEEEMAVIGGEEIKGN